MTFSFLKADTIVLENKLLLEMKSIYRTGFKALLIAKMMIKLYYIQLIYVTF